MNAIFIEPDVSIANAFANVAKASGSSDEQ